MLFEQFKLNANILRGIHAGGYILPTPFQSELVPAALGGRDVLASAYSGSGKTAAYALIALQKLTTRKNVMFSNGPRIIIVAPSKQSVLQASKLIRQIGKYMRYRIQLLAQGLSNGQQLDFQPEELVDILVATPDRLLADMHAGRLDRNRLELLIFDEVDQLESADVEEIARAMPKQKQVLMITTDLECPAVKSCKKVLQKPVTVEVEAAHVSGRHLRHYLYASDDFEHKLKVLVHVLNEEKDHVMLMMGESANVDELVRVLSDNGIKAARLSREGGKRGGQLSQFKEGAIQVLVANVIDTLTVSDCADVRIMIQYTVPEQPELYLQRVAPMAHNRNGSIFVIVTHDDAQHINNIEHLMGYHFTFRTIEGLEPKTPFYRPKIKLKRDHLGRIVRRPSQYSGDNRNKHSRRQSKQKSGHLRMLRRVPRNDS